jgi:hypothetical protein
MASEKTITASRKPSRKEVATYISDVARELTKLANGAGLSTTAYFLEMASHQVTEESRN